MPAKQLIERHACALRWRDVWLFSSGPVGEPPRFEDEPVDIVGLISQSGARGHSVFAGSRGWLGIDEWAGQIVTAAREVGTSGAATGPLVPVP